MTFGVLYEGGKKRENQNPTKLGRDWFNITRASSITALEIEKLDRKEGLDITIKQENMGKQVGPQATAPAITGSIKSFPCLSGTQDLFKQICRDSLAALS